MEILTEAEIISKCSSAERVLLINAPAVDIRLPWARWQQPIGLLKIGTYLRSQEHDVRLIDCLQVSTNNRQTREKVGQIEIEGYRTDLWRFGLSPSKVISRLREWGKQEWIPDVVLVSCGMSFWWQGAKELISLLKSALKIPVILGGPYSTYYSEHAALETSADALFIGDVSEANRVVADLNLYAPGPLPRFAGIHLLNPSGVLIPSASPRNPRELADEVEGKARLGVTAFAFFDPWLGPEHRQPFVDALTAIAARQIPKIHFIAPGNLSPRLIEKNLATVMKRVGFKHIFLHDDIFHSPNKIEYLTSLDDYGNCMQALKQAGFHLRTDEVGAAVLLGLPGENLEDVTERLIRLSSLVGSIHLVPFQFTPATAEGKAYESWLAQRNGHFDPASLNGKTFPLARLADASYEEYLEITRLVALLNSKYHSRTFDFLGSGLTAQLVRKSLQDQLWNPFSKTNRAGEREDFIPIPLKEDM